MCFARYQFECCSRKSDTTKAIANAVIHANGGVVGGPELDGYSGKMMGDVKVWFAVIEDRRGDYIPPAQGEESPRWKRRILDLMICYNE
jgi:hypothetical protein